MGRADLSQNELCPRPSSLAATETGGVRQCAAVSNHGSATTYQLSRIISTVPARHRHTVRYIVAPRLTRREIRALQARAVAERRSMTSLVSRIVLDHLRGRGSRPAGSPGPSREQLVPFSVALRLTTAQKRTLVERAAADLRSPSSYVAAAITVSLRVR